MNQLSPLCYFPKDVLQYAFCQGAPSNVKQLIILSLVCKQFNLCFNDFSLWRQFADKHSITNCTTGAQVKQALIDIARREFNPKGGRFRESSFYEVHTTLTYCTRQLSDMETEDRYVEPCGGKLPITFNNKVYFEGGVLHNNAPR